MIKKLPKATAQTFDDIRRERDTTKPAKAAKPSARRRRPASAKAGDESRTEAPPPPPAAAEPESRAAELRQARAGRTVERYAAYSAVSSIVPIPLLDTLGVVWLIVLMVKSLAELYDSPFDRDRVRAVVAGLIGGVGQAGAGTVVTASLVKLTPGANAVGAAASSAASLVLTRAIGQAFVLHFETGGSALDLDPATLRVYFDQFRRA